MINAKWSLLIHFGDLAAEARPRDDADWGSERQLEAENKFFDSFDKNFPRLNDSEFRLWCLKATCNEMLDEAMKRIAKALHDDIDQDGEQKPTRTA